MRKYQSGEHAADCQKLLNEIARARLCLLKPAAKAVYDADLRGQLDGPNEFARIEFDEASPEDVNLANKPRKKSASKTKAPQRPFGGLGVAVPAAVGGVVLVLLIVGVMLFRRPENPPPPAESPAINPVEVALTDDSKSKPTAPPADNGTGADDKSKTSSPAWLKVQRRPRDERPKGPIENVLPLLKAEHAISGVWSFSPNKVESGGTNLDARVVLPVTVPSEYTVHVRGTRQETQSNEFTLGLVLVWKANETTLPGFRTKIGQPFEVDAIVRHEGVEVRVDGRTVVDWKGDFSRFSLGPVFGNTPDGQLALVSASKCVFTELTVGAPLPPQDLPGSELKTGETVDILPLVDVTHDAWGGSFTREGNTLKSDASRVCNLTIPFVVPKEYSLLVDFETASAASELYVGFPVQTGHAIASFGNNAGGEENMLCIDRMWSPGLPDRYVRRAFKTTPRTSLLCTVRNSHLHIRHGNDTIFDWHGDCRRLVPESSWATPGNLVAIGTHEVVNTIHSLQLTRLPDSPSSLGVPRPPVEGNLLEICHPQRDAMLGYWTKVGDYLKCFHGFVNAIRFPAELPANYEFRLVVVRDGGNDLVEISVPVNGYSATIAIDGNTGRSGGIEYVDGKRFDSNSVTVNYAGHKLNVQSPSIIEGRVDGRRLTVQIDNQPFFDRELPETLIDPAWEMRPGWLTPKERLHLAVTTKSEMTVREVRFRPLTATAPKFPPLDLAELRGIKKSETPPGKTQPMPATAKGVPTSVPDMPSREAAAKKIREALAAEFSGAKKDADKLALATKLETLSKESQDDPATKFACLELARDLASEAGDLTRAFACLETLSTDFEVDPLELKAALVKSLGPKVKGPLLNKELLEKILPLIDGLIASERFPQAVDMATLANQVATKAKDKAAQGDITSLKKDAEELAKEFAIADAARKALESRADDADAKVKWGRWLCLRKGKWDEGLPLLAGGSNAQLKSLAERDLKIPADKAAMVALANGWVTFAKLQKDHSEAQFADRAMFWLQKAVEQSSGLEKSRNEQLLAKALDVRDWDSPLLALLDQVEKKVQQGRISRMGETPHEANHPFESRLDPPGILIGMNCAVGVSGKETLIRAVQPVYFTKLGVRPGPWHGGPQDARVQSIVEIRARAGYAVNGLSSQVSSGFDNTQFSFAKVTRLGLDPQRTYQSEVIGLPRKPVAPFVSISGNQPIIGITGHADNILYGLGLIATK